MRLRKYYFTYLIIVSLLFLLAIGCYPFSGVSTQQITTKTFTEISITPHNNSTARATFPPLRLTKIPSPFPPTYPASILVTWTPLPTLSPSESILFIENLYEQDNCLLPCWWGILPGETSWLDAWQFLSQFSTNTSPWQTSLSESRELPGYILFPVYVNHQDKLQNNLLFVIDVKTLKVEYIRVNTSNRTSYTIPQIFALYGEPEEIFIFGGGGNAGVYSLSLYLYYPKQGFLSKHYKTVNYEDWITGKVKVCNQDYTELFMWSKSNEVTIQKLSILKLTDISSFTIADFKPIENVTDLNVADFYNKYKGFEGETCIEIKTDLLYP